MPIAEYTDKQQISDIFLLKKFEIRDSRNGKKFADIIFADNSGEISAKIWDVSNLLNETYSSGDFVYVKGNCEIYKDNMQVILNEISHAVPSEERMSELILAAPFPPLKMYEKILDVIDTAIENEEIKQITRSIFEDKKDALMYYPAAKSFHHAVKSGLLYHTFTMLRSAKQLCEIYTFLNKDLVFSGVILHDLGKTSEMDSNTFGVVTSYTKEGLLLGHIVSGICDIDDYAKRLNISQEVTLLLKHIILSHHLVPEFGSPKPPMIPEAEMIHYLDELDSRMNQMENTLKTMKKGTFADKVWVLDNRSLYCDDL